MTAAKKSHLLQINPESVPMILGIISAENDYTLCFQLNTSLGLQLTKHEDVTTEKKGKIISGFSCFYYSDPDETLIYRLIKNRSQTHFLIPEQKNTDYFLIITGELDDEVGNGMVKELRSIPEINAVLPLDVSKLKSTKNLIF